MALNLQTLTDSSTSAGILDDLATVSSEGDLVASLENKVSGGPNATQTTSTEQAVAKIPTDGNQPYLLMDIVDDEYEFTTGSSAINGTIVVATLEGTYSANISLSASTQYDLQARGVASTANNGFLKNVIGYLITPTQLSDSEITNIEAYFVDKGAAARSAFGSVTSFVLAWRRNSTLTSFPLIDTSSGESFDATWRDCTSLTSFPAINTSSGTIMRDAWRSCSSLTTFPSLDTSSATTFDSTWRDCTSLTSFPQLDASSGTVFFRAWYNCSSLTSFPAINTSSGENFQEAWYNCSSLTSFPMIDTSSGTSFSGAWRDCSSLTSFPLIDTSSGTTFALAWYGCASLTSFPAIDTPSGTNFLAAWYSCTNLTTFPTGFFDSWSPASVSNGVFNLAWDGCTSLTAQSVENILTSIDTSGIYGTDTGLSSGTQLGDHTIDIDYDGTTLSSATATAITNLKNKDWAISINSVIR